MNHNRNFLEKNGLGKSMFFGIMAALALLVLGTVLEVERISNFDDAPLVVLCIGFGFSVGILSYGLHKPVDRYLLQMRLGRKLYLFMHHFNADPLLEIRSTRFGTRSVWDLSEESELNVRVTLAVQMLKIRNIVTYNTYGDYGKRQKAYEDALLKFTTMVESVRAIYPQVVSNLDILGFKKSCILEEEVKNVEKSEENLQEVPCAAAQGDAEAFEPAQYEDQKAAA